VLLSAVGRTLREKHRRWIVMFLISGRDRQTDTKSGELFRQRFRRAMLLLALRLWRQDVARSEAANRLFAFSIFYVVLLFGTLLLERIILT
jgi:hypothetical protein